MVQHSLVAKPAACGGNWGALSQLISLSTSNSFLLSFSDALPQPLHPPCCNFLIYVHGIMALSGKSKNSL